MTESGFSLNIALFDGNLRDEMFMLLDLARIKNYTHFVGLHGSSNEGKKDGSVAWPGSNEILLLLVNDEEKDRLVAEVKRYKQERDIPPGLITFSWPVAEVF